MKVKSIKNEEPADILLHLEDMSAPHLVTMQDLYGGQFVLLFESMDGRPTERIIASIRAMADALEKRACGVTTTIARA